MGIFESVPCLPGYEHSVEGHVIKSDGVRIEIYYCPRCNQIVHIDRTGSDTNENH